MDQNTQQPPVASVVLFPVESQKIAAAGYDPVTKTLGIQFKDNGERTYQYQNVPEAIWDGFEKATSKGTYFYGSIFNKFGFLRVEADGTVSKVALVPQDENQQPQFEAPLPEAA